MTIPEAMKVAAKRAGWSTSKLARVADVTEGAAYKWFRGAIPSGDKLMVLRRELPGFAELLDAPAEQAVA